jgi:predicted anti-sigma-YlaC factor YlaD
MRCSRYRQALSARIDGEAPGVDDAALDAHVATCDECRAWVESVGALVARMDVPATPDLDPAVLVTLMQGANQPKARMLSLGEWRIVMGIVGVLQLVTAWPGVMLHDGHASEHLAHELTTWDLGLAVGFILLAFMPSRAWGALPVVAVLVVALVGTSVADLATGHALLGRELVHLLEVAGLGCLWVLARRVPRSSVVVRLA